VADTTQEHLVKHLTNAHAMEEQSVQLLDAGAGIAGDEEIARIYRAHLMQTKEHVEHILKRLQAHGESPSKVKDIAMKGGALAIGGVAMAAPNTPVTLAAAAFAYESLEVASYRLLHSLAERAGDTETVAVVERILEQEEAAVELVAGTFDRVVDLTLGEPAVSPLTPVTPIGKPSERPPEGP
jgi:ferritin-like metal-binding protein YciE